jgi:hypothetical protein
MRALALSIVMMASVLGAGCQDAELEILGACAEDEHCGGGLSCHQGFCVEGAINSLQLSARVIPPPATGLLQQHVPSIPLGDGPNVTITLVAPAVLHGVVRHAGDALSVNVPGELEARTPGDLPGMDYRFTAKSIEGLDEMNQGFELRVLPGRPYVITFRPESKSLPPHSFTLEAQDAVSGELNLMLPDKSDYVDLEGFVRWASYKSIGNARVTAMLEDGLGVPTVTTDEIGGKFSLRLPPDTTLVQLVVEAPEDGPVFPSFTTDWREPSTDMVVDIPTLPQGLLPFDASIQVVAPGEDGEPAPAAGLTVSIRGELAGGSLRRSATTDSSGIASVEVLPGAYEVVVSVPPGQDYAGWSGAMNLLAPEDNKLAGEPTATIPLQPRPYVIGTVRDASGELVSGGKVVATRQTTATSGGLAFAPQPFSCAIDINGRFVLRVDTGRYEIRITPETETGAPPRILHDQEVYGDVDLEVITPDPGVARLTLLGPDELPLPNTTVELYVSSQHLGDPGAPQSLLAKGTSDETGAIDLLVPFEP